MIEKSKYYTPTIEEFHIGFEYETLVITNHVPITFFEERKFNFTDTTVIENDIPVFDVNTCRVKYLDRSDIESLGWKLKVSEGYDIFGLTISPKEGDIKVFNLIFKTHNGSQYKHIITFRKRILFEGYIKNRSELKKLMKQLQITE